MALRHFAVRGLSSTSFFDCEPPVPPQMGNVEVRALGIPAVIAVAKFALMLLFSNDQESGPAPGSFLLSVEDRLAAEGYRS
jgi:hypothetical protein